jgi:hypothetical protein
MDLAGRGAAERGMARQGAVWFGRARPGKAGIGKLEARNKSLIFFYDRFGEISAHCLYTVPVIGVAGYRLVSALEDWCYCCTILHCVSCCFEML